MPPLDAPSRSTLGAFVAGLDARGAAVAAVVADVIGYVGLIQTIDAFQRDITLSDGSPYTVAASTEQVFIFTANNLDSGVPVPDAVDMPKLMTQRTTGAAEDFRTVTVYSNDSSRRFHTLGTDIWATMVRNTFEPPDQLWWEILYESGSSDWVQSTATDRWVDGTDPP